jgi:hypothetical protein
MIKKLNSLSTLIAATLVIFGVSAFASTEAKATFSWEEARTLIKNCAVQPFKVLESGKTEFLPIRSFCPETVSVQGNEATLKIREKTYVVSLTESPFSDGGDLGDLTVTNVRGKIVATAKNLLAFGDVLLAVIGSETLLPQIEE